jgi:hypothetical protein
VGGVGVGGMGGVGGVGGVGVGVGGLGMGSIPGVGPAVLNGVPDVAGVPAEGDARAAFANSQALGSRFVTSTERG